MNTYTIDRDKLQQLANSHIHLDGSEMNLMAAETTVDQEGLHISGSVEAVVEIIMTLGDIISSDFDDEGNDVIDALGGARIEMTGDGAEVHLPGLRIERSA